MSGPKVFEFAKEIGIETLGLMNKLKEWNIPVKNHMAELDAATLQLIRQKMDEESATKEPATKKKVAKKAAATAVAKKATETKEAASKTTVVKKTAAVIRRKATDIAEAEKLKEEAREEAIASAHSEEIEAEKEVVVEAMPEPVKPKEVAPAPTIPAVEKKAEPIVAPTPAPVPAPVAAPVAAAAVPPPTAPAPEAAPKRSIGKREVAVGSGPQDQPRRNIIGRMDLSKAVPPPGSRGPGGGGGGGYRSDRGQQGHSSGGGFASRSSGIRTGFVAAAPAPNLDLLNDKDSRFNRDKDKRRVTGVNADGTVKEREREEEEVPAFSAAEFRKREMVFQPKKKKGTLNREAKRTEITTPKASKRVVKIFDRIRVSEFAVAMGQKAPALMATLMKSGVQSGMNDYLDFDTAALIAPEFGFEVENVKRSPDELVNSYAFGNLQATPVSRPPIVTVMGHVDHGKTTLLDSIRNEDVAAGEAGGITQHIGAYTVKLESGHLVTFIDTPGHEAFTAMRARGANATDIAIIVVAADDGMMPQTAEAISHAKAAGVPIIVAVNKMDKPGVNPDRIKQQLTEFELVPEEWGGTTIYCPVSALKRTGIKELLEQIHLNAEVADLKANPERSATGIVIEASMEKGRGVVATLLIKDGTLKVGHNVVAGGTYGRVRAMLNDKGQQVKEAGPSYAVEILGLNEVPAAGDRFDAVNTEEQAEEIAKIRKEMASKDVATPHAKMSLEDLFSKVQAGDVKELPIVLKADVMGSAEAIKGMLAKDVSKEVKAKIIHSAIGAVSESDVLLASTAKGIVIGFNVRPDSSALALAKREGVEIKTYSIVYELMDDIKKAMAGLLTPDVVEKVLGHAEVRNTFTVPKMGTIAGCFVQDGKIQRSAQVRLLREGRIVYDGKIGSLKRFKDDAREVATGFECGIGIENFNDIKVGDTLEVYEKEVIQKTL